MEELLNKLIKKGRKPRGYEDVYKFNVYKLGYTIARPQKQKMISFATERRHYINGTDYIGYKGYSLRELVSKESGLWQFCVENKLVNKYADLGPDEEEAYIGKRKSGLDAVDINGDYIRLDDDYDEYHQDTDYKYWLIECALKDEDILEKFLLDNIKIDGE